jgi:ATP:corrinoid adenosyltransferase
MRATLEVTAEKYEPGKGMEDGFEFLDRIITAGWINIDALVKIVENGRAKCPFITTGRGKMFIAEGDYIISEGEGDKHICKENHFAQRYVPIKD